LCRCGLVATGLYAITIESLRDYFAEHPESVDVWLCLSADNFERGADACALSVKNKLTQMRGFSVS
jgi:hypothetical protein